MKLYIEELLSVLAYNNESLQPAIKITVIGCERNPPFASIATNP